MDLASAFALHGGLEPSDRALADLVRLAVAALLGASIGIERELKHRPAGLRTILFITFGAALFTVVSERLAGDVPDKTRIAAQIVTGIGFIGAGSILHDKGSVSGLTSAAAIFVAAGIGMAAGGGLYWTAVFSTVITLICLMLLWQVEARLNLKRVTMSYDLIAGECQGPEDLLAKVNAILEQVGMGMETVHMSKAGDDHCHLTFTAVEYRSKQNALLRQLKQLDHATVAQKVLTEHD